MKTLLRTSLGLATLFAGSFAIRASAAIPLGENSLVQIGGFISQGYIKSDGNNYPFEDKGNGTFDFREMAFNASTTFGSHLRVGGQIFAERLGNYGEDKVKLDWAVADYNFRQEFGIRVGRVKYPKGLYGEALDLDVVRPYIFLPVSLYNPVVRDFNSAFNGGMIYGTINAGKTGSFDYKLFYGDIPMSPEQGVADYFNTTTIFAPNPGVTDLGMDATGGGQVFWNTPVTGLKVGYSYSYLDGLYAKGKLRAAPIYNASLSTDRYSYHTISAEYVRNQWTFAAEYQRVGGDFVATTPFGATVSKSEVTNWYVAAARRFHEKFEVGAYFAQQRNSRPAAASPSSANHNNDWTLSLRYDVNEHITVKAEGHYIDGTYNVFNTPRTPNATIDNTSTLFALKTTLSF